MVLANIEWIGSLCAVLILICTIQLIITGILLWSIPEVLTLTKSHVATLSGLIASFVTLPAVIRFKTARMSPEMDRTYGYTLCYQRLTLSVAACLHLAATVFTIVALFSSSHVGEDFMKLMKSYRTKTENKILIDNIQFLLECCGTYSYKDWYEQKRQSKKNNTRSSTIRNLSNYTSQADVIFHCDEVPFSCCAKSAPGRCKFRNLEEEGTITINRCGCGIKLKHFVKILLWCEFLVYGICFCVEVTVMVLLSLAVEDDDEMCSTGCACSKSSVETVTPTSVSSKAIMQPSSHSEKKT